MIVERGKSLVMEVIFFLFRCGVIDFSWIGCGDVGVKRGR